MTTTMVLVFAALAVGVMIGMGLSALFRANDLPPDIPWRQTETTRTTYLVSPSEFEDAAKRGRVVMMWRAPDDREGP